MLQDICNKRDIWDKLKIGDEQYIWDRFRSWDEQDISDEWDSWDKLVIGDELDIWGEWDVWDELDIWEKYEIWDKKCHLRQTEHLGLFQTSDPIDVGRKAIPGFSHLLTPSTPAPIGLPGPIYMPSDSPSLTLSFSFTPHLMDTEVNVICSFKFTHYSFVSCTLHVRFLQYGKYQINALIVYM